MMVVAVVLADVVAVVVFDVVELAKLVDVFVVVMVAGCNKEEEGRV